MSIINEFTVESGALDFLRGLGYQTLFGPEIEPGVSFPSCLTFPLTLGTIHPRGEVIKTEAVRLSFRDNKLQKAYQIEKERRKRFEPWLAEKFQRAVALLEAAEKLSDLQAFRHLALHPLKGDKQGFWSLTLHDRWRLILKEDDGEAGVIIIWEVTNHYGD